MPAKKKAPEVEKEEVKSKLKPNVKIKKPPIVFEKTQEHLEKLSKILKCPVLSYFKPPSGNIWGQDLYAILEGLKTIGKVDKLALYVRSNGGQGMVSLRIIHLLRSFAKKLIILAPAECASAATMLALGCDEIYMGPLSSLSPVDSSIIHPLSPVDKLNSSVSISLDELWRVLRLWQEAAQQTSPSQTGKKLLKKADVMPHLEVEAGLKADLEVEEEKDINPLTQEEKQKLKGENPYKYLYEYIHPLVFGAVDRNSSLSIRICKEIMQYHMQDEQLIEKINQKLNYDYPAHGYPITRREAEKIGLNVKEISSDMQDILNDLQLLYSELTEEKITDYDNLTYHDHSIYSVVESNGILLNYQQNYDKFYREAEKRYITLNDLSGWYKTVKLKGQKQPVTTRTFF